MRMLLALKKPKRILEVGTAVGFSTLLMCEYGRKTEIAYHTMKL